jgi:hypothetical protein
MLTIDFWNVAQGDCTVLTLPDGRLIMVDVGPPDSPVFDWLVDHPTLHVAKLLLTHNDDDHCGCLNAILEEFHPRVGSVHFLVDRAPAELRRLGFFRTMLRLHTARKLCVSRLEVRDEAMLLWSSADGAHDLVLLFPDCIGNVSSTSPNRASALICLRANGTPLVVWPGDSPLRQVATHLRGLGRPYFLMGPHHGAPEDRKQKGFAASVAAVAPQRGFLSLGTDGRAGNTYGHPCAGYIRALLANGCRVVCSQITEKCDRKRAISGRHVMNTTALYGLPAPAGVYCRGHLRVVVDGGTMTMDEHDSEHLHRVSELHRPLCL